MSKDPHCNYSVYSKKFLKMALFLDNNKWQPFCFRTCYTEEMLFGSYNKLFPWTALFLDNNNWQFFRSRTCYTEDLLFGSYNKLFPQKALFLDNNKWQPFRSRTCYRRSIVWLINEAAREGRNNNLKAKVREYLEPAAEDL